MGFFSTRLETTERLNLDRRDGGEGDVALVGTAVGAVSEIGGVECLRLNLGVLLWSGIVDVAWIL